jgi:hypothetical protein
MHGRAIPGLVLLAVLTGVTAARADEIRLKDGTKISGTIVGFENDSFKVETAYGFALIRKEKIADIVVLAPKKEPEPKAKRPPAAASPNVAAPTPVTPAAKEFTPAPITTAVAKPRSTEHPPVATDASLPGVKNETTPALQAPPAAPEPPVIREDIRGNLYVNLTYGFQMYKPPSWDLLPAARKALPDAVAALGTSDETTLLVIGREKVSNSLDAHAAATAKALSEIYENYRLISSRHVTVAGLPAVEQRSHGRADGRDWSVVLLTFLRGKDAFTLLGMTWADSDLIQVQENVITKTVNSLAFAPQ